MLRPVSLTAVNLSWTYWPFDETTDIFRTDPGEAERLIARAGAGTYEMLDSGLDPGTEYVYRVCVSNYQGTACSDPEAVTTPTEPYPTLTLADASVTEGNAGTTTLSLTASLSATSGSDVTFDWSTADLAATAGTDYTAVSDAAATIPAGSLSTNLDVVISGDTLFEADETLEVSLADVAGATIADGTAVGTITNDDTAPAISVDDPTVSEGDGGTTDLVFTVSLDDASSLATSVDYATADGTATTADADYTAAGDTLTIPAGDTSRTVTVQATGDTAVEPDETFTLDLSNPVNATIADAAGTGTIVNDDVPPAPAINIAPTAMPFGDVLLTTATPPPPSRSATPARRT